MALWEVELLRWQRYVMAGILSDGNLTIITLTWRATGLLLNRKAPTRLSVGAWCD